MRGIYYCIGQNLDEKSSGIAKKIVNQIKSMENCDIKMHVITIDNKMSLFDKMLFFLPLIQSNYQKRQVNAIEKLNLNEYDFIYIRRPVFSSSFIKMLEIIKAQNPKLKIILELPTYPKYGEYKGIRKLLIPLSFAVSGKLEKYIDRIVTYTNDELIWNIPTIKISNCVDFEKINKKNITSGTKDINVIAVALFTYWHGYDRFITGLKNYYASNANTRNVHLYLVGDSDLICSYRKLVIEYGLERYVHFCGKRFGSDLDDIYDKCELALDALGRHRSKVYFNSSLKGKEYGAKGLPIISGVTTELDSHIGYKYYLRIPSDETPVDIKNIMKFYDSIYNAGETKEQVITNIRVYSKDYFDFPVGFQPVLKYIKED
jgi:glycosyltransferase involved in cell wall biosynthesis